MERPALMGLVSHAPHAIVWLAGPHNKMLFRQTNKTPVLLSTWRKREQRGPLNKAQRGSL